MTGGQSWSVASGDSGRHFSLQVIERTNLTVPAGTFEAARLRIITTIGDKQSTKRTIWFAENIGIVKEEVIHYDASQIRVREHLELSDWVLPTLVGQVDPEHPAETATPSGITDADTSEMLAR